MTGRLDIFKKPVVLFLGGLLIGALAVLVVRFLSYAPEHIHYHANFAVYLNGQREQFKGPQYYQEVAICSATTKLSLPQQRSHLHDEDNSAVHVHDHVVTWGQFFNNLGLIIGPDFVATDKGTIYRAGGGSKLHVILNGQDYTDLTPLTNMVIGDKDKLLVSFGSPSAAQLKQEEKSIPATAAKYDAGKDPASCSSGESISWKDRLKHLFN